MAFNDFRNSKANAHTKTCCYIYGEKTDAYGVRDPGSRYIYIHTHGD